MASSGGVYSQTLQEITKIKLQELAKKRASFEKLKAEAIAEADEKTNALQQVVALFEGVKTCFAIRTFDGKIITGINPNYKLQTKLQNLSRFIDQAHFDPSISHSIIQQWKTTLLNLLDVQSLKYQYADLYGQLTVEWLSSSLPKDKQQGAGISENGDLIDNEDFEEVSTKAKMEAREKWERTIFEQQSIDQDAVTHFLDSLFDEDDAQKALADLRLHIANEEAELSDARQFDAATLRWVIKGLLASERLPNDKRDALRDFLSNRTVLDELADVLNMRMGALDTWSWGSEVLVEARRELNGKYDLRMHEDLLQAIFLQYIGTKWSVAIKTALMRFVWNKNVWKIGRKQPSAPERQRRTWYLPSLSDRGSHVQKKRGLYYRAGYFASQLLDSIEQDTSLEEGNVEADFGQFAEVQVASLAAAKSAPPGFAGATRDRMRRYRSDDRGRERSESRVEEDDDEDMGFGLFSDPGEDEPPKNTSHEMKPYRPANTMEGKQRLLHLLSTEILLKTHVDGEITIFRSQFDSWYASLPHTTTMTVLRYLGFSERWLDFFQKFLQAPLRFSDEDGSPRVRKRGTPKSHVLSDLFGESLLFCLDFAINKRTEGEVLWRMGDDFWFWSSSQDTCTDTWNLISQFNKIMGLTLDTAKNAAARYQRKDGKLGTAELDKTLPTGRIRWGMLFLDPDTGKFTIDEAMVDKHIEELRKQLKDKESSIFAWVKAYSIYASVFFTSNFGKPANCFGRDHIDKMLNMHERVQKTLFSTTADGKITSVVDWLKFELEKRFDVTNIPDGYFFFPTDLGGLDVKSPFIGPLQLRGNVTKDPETIMNTFFKSEREHYNAIKKRYLEKEPWNYHSHSREENRPENPEEFMSFEEYIRFREDVPYGFENDLVDTYEALLEMPCQEPVGNIHGTEIDQAIDQRMINAKGELKTITYWHAMDPYWKWVVTLYGPEMIGRFGGLEIVDAGLLPMGMVGLFRSGRTDWRE